MHITETKVNALERCICECEKAVIIHVLLKTKGDKSEAAELLGVKERFLANKINQYAIDCAQFE
jgi:DNA-binding NtrC family response regulator